MNCYRKFANVFRFMAEIPRIELEKLLQGNNIQRWSSK